MVVLGEVGVGGIGYLGELPREKVEYVLCF